MYEHCNQTIALISDAMTYLLYLITYIISKLKLLYFSLIFDTLSGYDPQGRATWTVMDHPWGRIMHRHTWSSKLENLVHHTTTSQGLHLNWSSTTSWPPVHFLFWNLKINWGEPWTPASPPGRPFEHFQQEHFNFF